MPLIEDSYNINKHDYGSHASSHGCININKFQLKKPYKQALVVPIPFQGLIHPLTQFAKRYLLPAGFKVVIANTQVNHQRIMASKTHDDDDDDDDNDDDNDVKFVALDDGLSPEVHDDTYALLSATISGPYQAAVQRLLNGLHPPASCIVSDVRLVFTQDLANATCIPRIAFWSQSASLFASNHLFAHGYRAPPDDSTFISCLHGVTPHKRSDVGWLCFDDHPHFIKRTQEPFKRINEAMCIVINTFEELESMVIDGLEKKIGFRPLALGPLVDINSFSTIKGINTRVDNIKNMYSWLDNQTQSSVLYVAFGTVVKLSNEQMEELVIGLESAKQPLIWAFRPSLLPNNSSVNKVVERLKRFGIIVPWAPQWQILCHPAIGGFITHCGWNSTIESITAGVPLLAWPQRADQFLSRRCIIDQWEIGLGFNNEGGFVSRVEVEKKVRQLLCEEKGDILRKNVKRLSTFAKKALAKEHEVYHQFHSLLKKNSI